MGKGWALLPAMLLTVAPERMAQWSVHYPPAVALRQLHATIRSVRASLMDLQGVAAILLDVSLRDTAQLNEFRF